MSYDTQEHWVDSWNSSQDRIKQDFNSKFSNKKKLLKPCLLSFLLVVVGDLLGSFDNYAITHDWYYTQMVSGLITQLVWLTMSFLFISADTKRERIAIGISQALGASIGSSIMLGYIKPLFVNLAF
jgi:uncharacterized membrane protein